MGSQQMLSSQVFCFLVLMTTIVLTTPVPNLEDVHVHLHGLNDLSTAGNEAEVVSKQKRETGDEENNRVQVNTGTVGGKMSGSGKQFNSGIVGGGFGSNFQTNNGWHHGSKFGSNFPTNNGWPHGGKFGSNFPTNNGWPHGGKFGSNVQINNGYHP